MTHPPGGPSNPPPPSGPRPLTKVTPLDPDSEAGREAAASLSQALAEIFVAVVGREAAARAQGRAA